MSLRIRISPLICVLAVCHGEVALTADQNWPQFRGADARGVSENNKLPVQWSATENVEWKTNLPGRGWSSPIVWGERVFLTSVINSEKPEEPKKGLYFGGNRPKPESRHRWMVYCLNLTSGSIVWQQQVHEGVPDSGIHVKNSFASESAVTDGERIYAYFGNLGVFCFDLSGKKIWEQRLGGHKTRYGWGTAASPVLHDNRLYVVNDNDEDSYLLALDAVTGNQIWRTTRDEKSNWATPYIWQNNQRTEIITPGTGKVRSYNLDGKLLWEFGGMSSITIATPYEHDGLLYISSGYVGDVRRRPIFAMKPGANGDVTLNENETSNEWVVWCRKLAGPYNPSTLIYNDRLVVLYDFGFIASFNPSDGSEIAPKRRIPQGKAFTSSPWGYAGKVFCLNEDGITFVLNSTDELELLHRNSLADDDMAMATPAFAGDRLLIRTSARIYCIKNGAGEK